MLFHELFQYPLHTNFTDVVSVVNNSIGRTVTKLQSFYTSPTVALLLLRISMLPCSMFPSTVGVLEHPDCFSSVTLIQPFLNIN
jgi:hypothetical protein